MKRELENALEELNLAMHQRYETQIKIEENFFKTSGMSALVCASMVSVIYFLSHFGYVDTVKNYFFR